MLSHKKLEIDFRVIRDCLVTSMLFVCLPNRDLCLFNHIFGGSCRVILVAAFGFLPQHFRWWGPTNGIFLLYECRLSGGDTQGC